MKTFALLLVLAPGIATAILGFIVGVVPWLKKRFSALMNDRTFLSNAVEIAKDSRMAGTWVGALTGFTGNDLSSQLAAAALTCAGYVVLLTMGNAIQRQKERLDALEKKKDWQD